MISLTPKKAFTLALLSSAAAGIASPAMAQQTAAEPPVQAVPDPTAGQADPGAPREGGAIIVTGSRIARRDLTSTSPLAVVQDEEFRLSGAVNVEQVINTLPQVIPGTTAFSNNPGGGFATLNLRGLGSQRTMVLVNGRRWMFYSPAQTVDLNTIPSFLIDSVDVVTGGASAVYGSDALAGVVNFRLRQDLDGLIAGGQYSITERGDGGRYNAYMALGTQFADGRGHVATYAEYYNRGRVMQSDRDFSFFALGEGTGANAGRLVPAGSANVPQGRIVVPAQVTLPAIGGQPAATRTIAAGTNYGTASGAFFATPGISRPYAGNTDAHNYAPENYLMVPQERWLLGGYGEYEVTSGINLYAEVSYINNRVANELAATPITQTVDVNLNAVCPLLSAADCNALRTISANQLAANAEAAARGNPLPFGSFTFNAGAAAVQVPALAAGNARIEVNQRVTQVGSRNTDFEQNSWRTMVGSRGNITDTLTYDVHYLFARNRNSNIQEGNISRRAFYNNVANGTCNVFGGNTLSQTCINNLSITAQNTTVSQLQVAQALVSGPLFQFGSATDPVAFAAGVEWRSMRGQFIPDTALRSGDVVGFNAGQPTLGGYNVKEAFAEIRVPIVQDGFIHRLEVTGAGRYSDYSLANVGGVWTYAAGAYFAPVRDITFRGNYQRAIRAPNVGELFGGQSIGFPQATDPCAAAAAAQPGALRDLCIATGVPPTAVGTGLQLQPNAQIQGIFGGNPLLQEEVADTWTVGAVIRPRFIPRLNITIDYYDIEIVNAIAAAAGGVANILNLCYNQVRDANHPLCRAIVRNPLTGVISGGQFVINAANANLGALLTNGVDFQVDYSLPLAFSALGNGESRLSFFLLGNWTDKNDFIPVVGIDTINECAGRFGSTCGEPTPKWKWTTRLSWIDGPITTSLRWRHISGVDDDSPAVRVVERLPAFDYFDLAFAFDVSDNLTLNLGVNNLFDKQPPIMGANAQQANTWPGTYDVLGRDFFVSANFRF
jgi:iron complex outermembrane recepter protein